MKSEWVEAKLNGSSDEVEFNVGELSWNQLPLDASGKYSCLFTTSKSRRVLSSKPYNLNVLSKIPLST